MSLRHDFSLVQVDIEENKIDLELCMKVMQMDPDHSYTLIDRIDVEDAVFDFFWFSFEWIPSINPEYNDAQRYSQGLNRYGERIFYEKSRQALDTNCKCWLQLIQYAPDDIKLYNSYIDSIKKKDVVLFFDRLLDFCGKLDHPNVFIFHSGI